MEWWKEKWNERREKERDKTEKWIGNKIGYEGAKTISESLKINTSLTSLDLGSDEKNMKWKWKKKWNEWKWSKWRMNR